MQQWICDQNIKLFRAALSGPLAPEQRATIGALLAKELAESDFVQHSIPAVRGKVAPIVKQRREQHNEEAFPSVDSFSATKIIR